MAAFYLEDGAGVLTELNATFRPEQWSVGSEGGSLERGGGSSSIVYLGDGLPAPARYSLVGTMRGRDETELRLRARELNEVVRAAVKLWRDRDVYLPVSGGHLKATPLRVNRVDIRISFSPGDVFWRDADGLGFPF